MANKIECFFPFNQIDIDDLADDNSNLILMSNGEQVKVEDRHQQTVLLSTEPENQFLAYFDNFESESSSSSNTDFKFFYIDEQNQLIRHTKISNKEKKTIFEGLKGLDLFLEQFKPIVICQQSKAWLLYQGKLYCWQDTEDSPVLVVDQKTQITLPADGKYNFGVINLNGYEQDFIVLMNAMVNQCFHHIYIGQCDPKKTNDLMTESKIINIKGLYTIGQQHSKWKMSLGQKKINKSDQPVCNKNFEMYNFFNDPESVSIPFYMAINASGQIINKPNYNGFETKIYYNCEEQNVEFDYNLKQNVYSKFERIYEIDFTKYLANISQEVKCFKDLNGWERLKKELEYQKETSIHVGLTKTPKL